MSGELDGVLLKNFVAIVECQGFSAAAERLHKTQSTVSQSLQRLEELVGAPLINRTSRSVALTAQGENFLIYARRILKLHQEAINAAHLPTDQGCVRIGLPEDYAQFYLADVLGLFKQDFPNVRPDVCCEMSTSLVARVLRGELDLVMGVQHANLQQGEFICDEPLVWVSAHPWTGGGDSIPLAVYLEGCAFRTNAISALAGAGRAWHVVYTSQSPRGISVAIDSWQTVGVTARRLVPPGWQILDESVGFPPIEPAKLTLWRSPANNDPAIDVLIDIFQQQMSSGSLFRQNRLHSVALGHGL